MGSHPAHEKTRVVNQHACGSSPAAYIYQHLGPNTRYRFPRWAALFLYSTFSTNFHNGQCYPVVGYIPIQPMVESAEDAKEVLTAQDDSWAISHCRQLRSRSRSSPTTSWSLHRMTSRAQERLGTLFREFLKWPPVIRPFIIQSVVQVRIAHTPPQPQRFSCNINCIASPTGARVARWPAARSLAFAA